MSDADEPLETPPWLRPPEVVQRWSAQGGGVFFDFWATQRALTKSWGSGQIFERVTATFGKPDAVFGATDNVPLDGIAVIDRSTGHEWKSLGFPPNQFAFGYWDPPYTERESPVEEGERWVGGRPKMFKREGMEIWRVCRRLAILHTHVWPRAWLEKASPEPVVREAMVAVTMGPLKQIRCLQVFRKGARKEGENEESVVYLNLEVV